MQEDVSEEQQQKDHHGGKPLRLWCSTAWMEIFARADLRNNYQDIHELPVSNILVGKNKWASPTPKHPEDSNPQDHTGCKCYKTKCSRPLGIWWKINASSASLIISTLNSYTGVRSLLRTLQKVAQWVLCSQGRKTFGGLLTICWIINYLIVFSANENNHRPIMLIWLLLDFLRVTTSSLNSFNFYGIFWWYKTFW